MPPRLLPYWEFWQVQAPWRCLALNARLGWIIAAIAFILLLILVVVPGISAAGKHAIDDRGIIFIRDGWAWRKQNIRSDAVKLCRGGFPAVSPDGARVAFFRTQGPADGNALGGVFMIRDLTSGREMELMPSTGCTAPPSWSPNGSCVAAAVFGDNQAPMLMVFQPSTGHRQQVLFLPHADGVDMLLSPTWKHDGTRIVFHDMTTLFEITLSGEIVKRTSLAQITRSPTCVTSADRFVFCPTDPDLIAYSRMDEASPDLMAAINEQTTSIYVERLSTGETKRLTPPDMVAFDFCWSLDGEWILFCGYTAHQARERSPFRVQRIDRNGMQLLELERGSSPTW